MIIQQDSYGCIFTVNPCIDYAVRKLCLSPYHNHRHGCPNYGNKKKCHCPPHGPRLEEIIDIEQTIYCVYNIFPFGEHVEKMRSRHPKWTEYQVRCCLYWQPKARKQLEQRIKAFLEGQNGSLLHISSPEGCGVDVTRTMQQNGIKLEWPPENVAYQISLLGSPVK